jgi:hypothetical protein
MAIEGAVSVAAVRHMHSTVERETDQLKNADAEGKIGVCAHWRLHTGPETTI